MAHHPIIAGSLETGLCRDRFPLLRRELNGRPLVYLDNAATTQKPEAVLAALDGHYREHNANVHRGLNALAAEATAAYEHCREAVARWLNVPADAAVVITRGATAGLNLVARGWERQLREGDEILLTEMEHHANLVPWQMLAARKKLGLRFLPLDDAGGLDLSQLPALLTERTRIVALTHVSNVLGTVNPVAEIVAAARKRGALTVVDAAQSVGHRPVDFAGLGADVLVFSAHKCYGPLGLGFLLGQREVLERLEPLEGGGEMIEWVQWESSTWAEVPRRFEAGTPNIVAAAAFPAAIALLEEIGPAVVQAHEEALTAHALEELRALGGLTIFGPREASQRGGLIAFHDPLIHPHDLSTVLDEQGIVVRAGHHCAQPLHRRLGVPATTRASFGIYNRRDEIDALVAGIRTARKVFGA
jgi:cysteine desulfurase/selenocysteine lyase